MINSFKSIENRFVFQTISFQIILTQNIRIESNKYNHTHILIRLFFNYNFNSDRSSIESCQMISSKSPPQPRSMIPNAAFREFLTG